MEECRPEVLYSNLRARNQAECWTGLLDFEGRASFGVILMTQNIKDACCTASNMLNESLTAKEKGQTIYSTLLSLQMSQFSISTHMACLGVQLATTEIGVYHCRSGSGFGCGNQLRV